MSHSRRSSASGPSGVRKAGSRPAASSSAVSVAGRTRARARPRTPRRSSAGQVARRRVDHLEHRVHQRCRTRRPIGSSRIGDGAVEAGRRPQVRLGTAGRLAGDAPVASSSSLAGSGSLPTAGGRRLTPWAAAVSAEYDVRRHSRSSSGRRCARAALRRAIGRPPRRDRPSAGSPCSTLDPGTERRGCANGSPCNRVRRGDSAGRIAGRAIQEALQRRARRVVRRRPPGHHLALGPGQRDVEQPQVLAGLLGPVPARTARAGPGRCRPPTSSTQSPAAVVAVGLVQPQHPPSSVS